MSLRQRCVPGPHQLRPLASPSSERHTPLVAQAPDPPNESAETTRAVAISASVANRNRFGVIQVQPRLPSHALIPLAEAVAVIAPIMHCTHMTQRLHPTTRDQPP
jgi:hypothetical protein